MSDALPFVLSGGTVLPCDGVTPPQEAIAVGADGRILGVGSEEEMSALAGARATRLNLAGATVLPGLVDGHSHHMQFTGYAHGLLDLLDARDHDDIVDRIRKRAEVTPEGEWIQTTPVGEPHYFLRRSYRDLAEGVLPDRTVLDRATTAHPVVIQAWAPTTPQMTAFNSAALKVLGIDESTPERVETVEVEKQDGIPTGRLSGPVYYYYSRDRFWASLRSKMPSPPQSVWPEATRQGMSEANRHGITTVYACHANRPHNLDALRHVRDLGLATLRVLATLDAVTPGVAPTPENVRERLALATALKDTHDPLLRLDGVTIGRGGPLSTGDYRTAAPYRHPLGGWTNGDEAAPRWVEEMVVAFCSDNDLRLNATVYSPLDHQELLETIDRFADRESVRRGEWVAQHCVVITEDQARRYADLNFHITTAAGFAWGMGDLTVQLLGEDVLGDLVPMRRLTDLGLNVTCFADWGPDSPFEQMWLAQTHEFAGSGRRNAGRDQALDREAALATWTRNGARLTRWEGVGSLRPGHHADLAVVDRNPLTCPLDDLPETTVLSTVLGGRPVHDTGLLAGLDHLTI